MFPLCLRSFFFFSVQAPFFLIASCLQHHQILSHNACKIWSLNYIHVARVEAEFGKYRSVSWIFAYRKAFGTTSNILRKTFGKRASYLYYWLMREIDSIYISHRDIKINVRIDIDIILTIIIVLIYYFCLCSSHASNERWGSWICERVLYIRARDSLFLDDLLFICTSESRSS